MVKLCHPKGNVGEYPVNTARLCYSWETDCPIENMKTKTIQKHLIAQTKTCFTKDKVSDLIKKTPIVNTMLRCNVLAYIKIFGAQKIFTSLLCIFNTLAPLITSLKGMLSMLSFSFFALF